MPKKPASSKKKKENRRTIAKQLRPASQDTKDGAVFCLFADGFKEWAGRLIRGDACAFPNPIVAAEKGAFPTAKVKRRPAVDTLPVVLPTVAAVDAARFHRYTWKRARRFSSTAGRSCSAIRMEMSTSEVVISRMSPVCSLTRRKAWAAHAWAARISSP